MDSHVKDFLVKICICLVLAGGISIYWGIKKLGEVVEATDHPQTITLQELLDRGPKGNHHLSITKYHHDDSFVSESTKDDVIPTGYIPLTVENDKDGRVVVLKTSGFRLQFGGVTDKPLTGMLKDERPSAEVLAKLKDKYPKLNLDGAMLFDEGETPTSASTGLSFIGLGLAACLPLIGTILFAVTKDRRERARAGALYAAGMLPGPPPARKSAQPEEAAGGPEERPSPLLHESIEPGARLPWTLPLRPRDRPDNPAKPLPAEEKPADSETIQEALNRIRTAVSQFESPKAVPLTRRQVIVYLVCGGALTVAAGVGSWFVGGGTLWKLGGWIFGIAIVILLLLVRTRRRQKAADWLLLAGLGSAMAVWIAVGWWFPITTIHIDAEKIVSRSRVTYNGEIKSEWPTTQGTSFSFRGPVVRAKLKIETLGPTGWFAREYSTYGDSISLGSAETSTLMIDNRGHDAATLNYGEMELKVAANIAEKRTVLSAPFGGAVPLSIDGKLAGSIDGNCTLIDVLGTRSYRLREVVYEGELRQLGHLGGGDLPEPQVKYFSKSQVHRLRSVPDYFMEHAPEKISITTIKGLGGFASESRLELVEDEE